MCFPQDDRTLVPREMGHLAKRPHLNLKTRNIASTGVFVWELRTLQRNNNGYLERWKGSRTSNNSKNCSTKRFHESNSCNASSQKTYETMVLLPCDIPNRLLAVSLL